jgi:hypothetical protein
VEFFPIFAAKQNNSNMKYLKPFVFLALLVSFGCQRSIQNGLRYRLSYDAAEQKIQVEMQYMPASNDSMTFVYGNPGFGGQQDIFNCVRDLTVFGKHKVIDSLRQVTVYPEGKKPFDIHYSIVDDGAKGQFVRELFRPVLKEDYLYCASLNVLFLPDDGDMPVSLQWTENEPFPITSYIDPNLKAGEWWEGKVGDLGISLFVGGTQVALEQCKSGNADGYVLTSLPDSLKFNAGLVKDFFVKYFATCREAWSDSVWEEYSLAVLPFLDKDINHTIGGIGFQKGFCAKYTPKGDTVLNEVNMFTVAHEIGHHWIGRTLITAPEDQWFGEGFNDYQTYYNLSHCGLMSNDWFERRFNSEMEAYYNSPISTLPNEEVWKNYWTMGDYNRLPYRRGCIFAFFLDNQIRFATDGRADFMSLMRSLKQLTLAKGNPNVSVEEFIQTTAQYLPGNEIKKYIDNYIMQGQLIDFSTVPLSKEFSVSMEEGVPVVSVMDKAY